MDSRYSGISLRVYWEMGMDSLSLLRKPGHDNFPFPSITCYDICPAVHVRPLRGLSTLLALTPGRSRSWWLASLRHHARSTTWGHSRCDPSGVSAHTMSYMATLRCLRLQTQKSPGRSLAGLSVLLVPRPGVILSVTSSRSSAVNYLFTNFLPLRITTPL